MIPAWRQAASKRVSLTAMEPVCERAADMPDWVRPPFKAITGLRRVTSRERSMKRRPSSRPSM